MKQGALPYCVLLVTLSSTQFLAQEAARPADMLVEPFQIVGNVYFVGPEAEHSSYLITTPEGHILINSGFERQLPTIRGNVEKLGFEFDDIRIVLGSHAHGMLRQNSIDRMNDSNAAFCSATRGSGPVSL